VRGVMAKFGRGINNPTVRNLPNIQRSGNRGTPLVPGSTAGHATGSQMVQLGSSRRGTLYSVATNRWRCMGLGGGGRTLKYTYPLGAVVDIRVFCLLYTFNLSQPVFVSTTYHPRRPCPPLADPHTAPWPLLTPRDKGSPPHSVRARVTRCTHAADLQGGHFSHWCSFPEPTARASHSQRRRTGRGVRP
jgi:hypothetical protein